MAVSCDLETAAMPGIDGCFGPGESVSLLQGEFSTEEFGGSGQKLCDADSRQDIDGPATGRFFLDAP